MIHIQYTGKYNWDHNNYLLHFRIYIYIININWYHIHYTIFKVCYPIFILDSEFATHS